MATSLTDAANRNLKIYAFSSPQSTILISLFGLEKELIRQALDQARGNKTTAARLLHITRDTLRYKAKKYKLE